MPPYPITDTQAGTLTGAIQQQGRTDMTQDERSQGRKALYASLATQTPYAAPMYNVYRVTRTGGVDTMFETYKQARRFYDAQVLGANETLNLETLLVKGDVVSVLQIRDTRMS